MSKIQMVPGEDRPEGTRLYKGELTKLLVELRKKEVAFYNETHFCLGEGTEILREAGFRVIESGDSFGFQASAESEMLFNGVLHPNAFGRNNYRGIFVYYRDPGLKGYPDGIFLYTPWCQPWLKVGDGTADQTVLVAIWGDVPEEFIEKVIHCYVEGQLKRIEEMYKVYEEMKPPTDSQGRS